MKKELSFFLIFIVLLFFTFRDLVLNLSVNLIDWRDYSLMVWIIFQNISKIQALDFQNFFNTSSFYPNTHTLLFSDLLLPQSLIALPIYAVFKNLILSFNIIFIFTFVLNYTSSFLFWRLIFKKNILAFFGSLFTVFSPFLHLELSHFQMMSYWPFFFSIYFLFKSSEERRYFNSFLTGIFLSIQFLTSVYLSVYLITVIGIFYLIKFTDLKNWKINLSNFSVVFLTFLLICGVFIKGYFDMKNIYNVNRNLEEYVTYSANLSDYLFSGSINTVIHDSPVLSKWNQFDKSGWGGKASFPGFLLFLLGLAGLFSIAKAKKTFSVILSFDKQSVFFFITMFTGFIFSLGPRLVFNGVYAFIPLPFNLALKLLPLFESTRVSARWSFLFYFGLIFFALTGLNKLMNLKQKNILIVSCFIIFLLEYIPLNITTSADSYTDSRDDVLKNLCAEKKQVVLELPVTHLNAGEDLAIGLSYITKTQLASSYHSCYLINGYSGYDLPENFAFENRIDQYIEKNDTEQFINELISKKINIIKFNPGYVNIVKQPKLEEFLKSLDESERLEKIDTTIYLVKPN